MVALAVMVGAIGCRTPGPPPTARSYARAQPCPQVVPTDRPKYPRDDDGTPLVGSVKLLLRVSGDGTVLHAAILASDHPRLERPACEVGLAIRFDPNGDEKTLEYTYTFVDDGP
jgi:hypothetical protein